jgi:hypothetical protein
MTIPMKTKSLHATRVILKKHWNKVNYAMDWRFHWSYLMGMINRENRFDVSASHNVLLDHLKVVSSFIFQTRRYFDPYDSNPNYMAKGMSEPLVEYAMKKLSDLRVPTCVEGLLALVLCLPTDFQQYDEYLPKWFAIWSSLDHNQLWDCCWLMIIARARKHSKSFNWNTVLPFLLTKSREVLSVPNVSGIANVNSNSFPKSFPTFYSIVLQQFKDLNSKMVSKIGKLIHKCALYESEKHSTEVSSVGAFSISPSNLVMDRIKALNLQIPALTSETLQVKNTCILLIQFFQSIRTLLHPSNGNNLIVHLAKFIEVLIASIAKQIGSSIGEHLLDANKAPIDSLTWNTLQYLQGIFLIIALESINSKNYMVQRIYVNCLNQLLSLNPVFIHGIAPYLLDALDAKSVTQPHRTLLALNCFASSMRTMLYPNPIILSYLPDILRLSLPGIDPSDPKKTIITMELFTNVFSWLPIHPKLAMKKSTNPHYTDFLGGNSSVISKVLVSDGDYDTQLEALCSFITDEWLSLFLDKIFALIGGLEHKMKGTKDSPMIASVSQCVGFIFQAFLKTEQGETLVSIQDKILNYVLTTAPPHTFKICGKLLESITANDQGRLLHFFQKIFDSEIFSNQAAMEKSNEVPVDKIKFRLVLAGGCCRSSKSEPLVACLSFLKPIFMNKNLLHHEDVKVRKAFCKFWKDFLKGSMSLYPVDIRAVYQSATVFCEPNIPTKNDIPWNLPSKEVVSAMIELVDEITKKAKEEINLALFVALDRTAKTVSMVETKTSYKKCEDMISNNLLLFVKMVRGLADILGDTGNATAMDEASLEDRLVMSTGREQIYTTLSEENKNFLLSYRRNLLTFLSELFEKLELCKEIPNYRGLYDNEYIAKQWMKCLMFTLTRRTSALKDQDGIRKWLKFQKTQNSSVMVRAIYEEFKYNSPKTTAEEALWKSSNNKIDPKLLNADYWKFHDLNTNFIACKIWLQHSIRASELSHAAVRIFVDGDNANDPTIKCINHLMSFARHEYDSIRPEARKIFEKISFHLGSKIVKIIENTLTLLSLPNANYYQTASTLVTMKQNSVMKRLSTNMDLKILFFNSFQSIQQSAANITDLDKREKIMLSLTDTISKYASSWSHSTSDLKIFYDSVFGTILNYFGNAASKSTESSSTTADDASSSGGLRMDTFLGYVLLHSVSTTLVQYAPQHMKAIWQLAFTFLLEGSGQPTQYIGEALFARLVEISFQEFSKNPQKIIASEWYQQLKEMISPSAPHGMAFWKKLLLGLARCHPVSHAEENAGGSNNPQWAVGIDAILTATEFLKIVKPRAFTSKGFEHNLCSLYFRKENVATFYSMIQSNLFSFSDVTSLEELFSLTRDIPSSSESEKRAINVTLAEFYSALLRSHNEVSAPQGQDEKLEKAFLNYLLERTESLSMDYSRDWEESVFFAYEGKPLPAFGLLRKHFLDSFHQIFRLNTSAAAAASSSEPMDVVDPSAVPTTVTANKTFDEGFSRQGKVLMLITAILNSDCIARAHNKERDLIVANEILAILTQPESNIIIPYRTSRIELSSILTTLSDHLSHNNSQTDNEAVLTLLYQKIALEATKKLLAVNQNKDVMVVEDAEHKNTEKEQADSKNVVLKNTIDTVLHLTPKLVQRIPVKYMNFISHVLFPVLVEGVIHSEAEVSRNSSDSLLFLTNACVYPGSGNENVDTSVPFFLDWLEKFTSFYQLYNNSWKVKEVIIKLSATMMINNWFILLDKEKKSFMNLFTVGLSDAQVNVREVSSFAMVGYLCYKTPLEMKMIAESYTRNSETLAAR